MITHESDSQLLKMYGSVLTDHAIKQVRDAYKYVSKIHENITIEENHDNTFDFINDNFHVTVSFNHNDQMLCNCPTYLQHQFVCPHMLHIDNLFSLQSTTFSFSTFVSQSRPSWRK